MFEALNNVFKAAFDWILATACSGVEWLFGYLTFLPTFDVEPIKIYAEYANFFVPLDMAVTAMPAWLAFEGAMFLFKIGKGFMRWA